MRSGHRKRFHFLSFIIPVCLLLIWFIWRGIAPFGEKTFLIHDMNAQYVDFFAYMRTILSGENDFSYMLSRELGGDFRSFFSYYLISPFNLIMILVPEFMIPAAISIELILLFGLAGLSCFICLNDYAGDKSPSFLLYLSTAWSLSAWMLLNAENFEFIPEAVIFPMVMAAFRKFRKEGKVIPLSLWLIAAVAVNFYLGYMICLFTLLWAVIPDGQRFDPKLFLIFLCVVLCSAPVWLPAARQLGTTIKQSDPFWYTPRINMSIKDLLWKFLPGSFDANQYQDHGLPAVYCGLITLAGGIYYFFGKLNGIKRHRLIILLVLLASLIFRPLTMIWQGFSEPHWWPYRFSFLFIFVLILCAAESRLRIHTLILLLGAIGLFYNVDKTFSVKLADCVSSAEYIEKVAEKGEVIGSIKASDSGIFRVGDKNPRSENDAIHFSYLGINGFDSLADRSVMTFLKQIGFPQNRYTVKYSAGNTVFANDLLGVRYRISGETILKSDIPAGLAFVTEKKLSQELPEAADAPGLQNSLAEELGVSGPVLSKVTEMGTSYDNFECSEEFCWTVSPKEPGSVLFSFTPEKDGFLYGHTDNPPLVGTMTLIRGESSFSLKRDDYFLPLGDVKAGETVEVELRISSPLSDIPEVSFFLEDSLAVSGLFTALYSDVKTEKISSSKLNIMIPQGKESRILTVTIPYDKRWKAASGTEDLQTVPVWGTFLGVILPADVSDIVLQYR